MSFVIYNTEGNGQEDNMERRRREGMQEEGDGTCSTGGSASLSVLHRAWLLG